MHLACLMEWDMSLQLQALGCQVVIVAQGSKESGVQWKKDYGLPFTLLIDRGMKFYRLFGLRREIKSVFKVETFTDYAARVIAEGSLGGKAYAGDDLTVMGGDFIVRQNGEVVFTYVQKSQLDRPAVSDLLQCLKN